MSVSESYRYLYSHPQAFDVTMAFEQLVGFRRMNPLGSDELLVTLHRQAPDEMLSAMAAHDELYEAKGASFGVTGAVPCLGLSVIVGLGQRMGKEESPRRAAARGMAAALVRSVSALAEQSDFGAPTAHLVEIHIAVEALSRIDFHLGKKQSLSLTRAVRKLASRMPDRPEGLSRETEQDLLTWAYELERAVPRKKRKKKRTRARKA